MEWLLNSKNQRFALAFPLAFLAPLFLGRSSSESSDPPVFFPSARFWSAGLKVNTVNL